MLLGKLTVSLCESMKTLMASVKLNHLLFIGKKMPFDVASKKIFDFFSRKQHKAKTIDISLLKMKLIKTHCLSFIL